MATKKKQKTNNLANVKDIATIQKKYQRKFGFNTRSTTAKTTPLTPKTVKAPQVLYTPEAWASIWYLVQTAPKEIGWLGMVDTLDNGDYLITDIHVPKQTVTGTETDMDDDDVGELYSRLLMEGRDTSKMFYWGHSHVNMGVTPSGQDEEQVDEYLEDCPIFIRGIYNKQGSQKVDVYDRDADVCYECVESAMQIPDELVETLDTVIKENVKERTYQAPKQSPAYHTRTVGQNANHGYGGTNSYSNYNDYGLLNNNLGDFWRD